jgi:hypothetical protein
VPVASSGKRKNGPMGIGTVSIVVSVSVIA